MISLLTLLDMIIKNCLVILITVPLCLRYWWAINKLLPDLLRKPTNFSTRVSLLLTAASATSTFSTTSTLAWPRERSSLTTSFLTAKLPSRFSTLHLKARQCLIYSSQLNCFLTVSPLQVPPERKPQAGAWHRGQRVLQGAVRSGGAVFQSDRLHPRGDAPLGCGWRYIPPCSLPA